MDAETDAILARIDDVLRRANTPPALGDPDVVLAEFGFPEPLRDERIHPTFAGILSVHLQAARGR